MASATRTHQTPPELGVSPNRPRVPEQVSQPESLKRLTMAAEGLVRQRRGRHGRAKKGLLGLPRKGGRSNNTNHTSPTNSERQYQEELPWDNASINLRVKTQTQGLTAYTAALSGTQKPNIR